MTDSENNQSATLKNNITITVSLARKRIVLNKMENKAFGEQILDKKEEGRDGAESV